jgi:hypothetical protein
MISQQNCPAPNSQAGHACRVASGQFFVSQHGRSRLRRRFFRARSMRIWRSAWLGMFLQPCSKLWNALREVPSNIAIWLWVRPRSRRICASCFLFTGALSDQSASIAQGPDQLSGICEAAFDFVRESKSTLLPMQKLARMGALFVTGSLIADNSVGLPCILFRDCCLRESCSW